MKILQDFSLAIGALVLLGLPLHSATATISYEGETTGTSTLPGSSTDFVIFNGNDFPTTPTVSAASDLTSFSISGGVQESTGASNFSSIIAPGGSTPVQTGDIKASTGFSLGANETGLGLSAGNQNNVGISLGSNPNFNYNDFDVFVMFSNVAVNSTSERDEAIDLVLPGQAYDATIKPVIDANTNTSEADYVEFNVQGLEAASDSYLVLSSFSSDPVAYIGGVSFESVAPEPSSCALCMGGLVVLGLALWFRRRTMLSR